MINEEDGISPLVTNAKAWSVDYARLTPLLLRAIQEQKAANDNQAARVDALEAELRELKAAIQH